MAKILSRSSLVAQLVKNPPVMWETWVGKIPWRRERLPTPVFWPGEFHGLYSPWDRKASDTTNRLSLKIISKTGNSGYAQSVFNFNIPGYCAFCICRCLPNKIWLRIPSTLNGMEKNEMGS